MPITQSAKKAVRSQARKEIYNRRKKDLMKKAVKEVRDLVKTKQTSEAEAKLPAAYKAIDKAAKRGVIKDNTAARKKSRLTKLVKGAQQ